MKCPFLIFYFSWYYGKVGRKDAEKKLLAPGLQKGTFIVRDGEANPGECKNKRRKEDRGKVE